MDRWRPTGTETSFTLSPILAPLAPVQDRLLVVDGLDMKSAVGEQHQARHHRLAHGHAPRRPPTRRLRRAGRPSIR